MKIKAYILDDEINNVDLLHWQIQNYCEQVEIVGQQTNSVLAIEEIKNIQPDVLFLDIQMPNMNGFEVIEALGSKLPYIIFITAFDQYAIKAIQYSALEYLLKPIDSDDLIQAVNKVEIRIQEGNEQQKILNLLETIASKSSIPGKIAVPTSDGLLFLKVEQILRCESDNTYTTIFMTDKKHYIVSKSIKYFDELLNNHMFFRIHQSHLINLYHIEKYVKSDGGSIIMDDGKELPLARNRKDDFLLKLENLS